ncbi:hypothetical protein ElyMa_005300100 [Elysia marginata]|uniref:Uncharacterized protein n=1 Tax=Elysia marginata TaxID=1093978 RepID=A0AAV4K2D0_9GAST|nr:hypothetical protein ElyMa_005300100 [Elysia marginata]
MQNVNNTRIVYTPAEIRHIGETSNPPPPKYPIPKCVRSVKTADRKPPTRKRTHRTKRATAQYQQIVSTILFEEPWTNFYRCRLELSHNGLFHHGSRYASKWPNSIDAEQNDIGGKQDSPYIATSS